MKRLCIAIVMFFIATFFAVENVNAEVKWHSFDLGVALAKKQGKAVIIDFYADWCHWCKVMEKETFNKPSVEKYINKNYICIRINSDKRGMLKYGNFSYTYTDFAKAAGVKGLPTVLFMDKHGKLVTSMSGYVKWEKFLNMLKFIRLQCYKKGESFQSFVSKKGECK